jgi:AAA domain
MSVEIQLAKKGDLPVGGEKASPDYGAPLPSNGPGFETRTVSEVLTEERAQKAKTADVNQKTDTDDWPEFERHSDFEKCVIIKPKSIIEGLLDEGSKFSLEGESKTNKSWLLADLISSVATGTEFLGMPTEKGDVLYVNLEIRRYWLRERLRKICQRKNLPSVLENLTIWNLRGRRVEIDKFGQRLLKRIGQRKFRLIVIDPIYKLLNGANENAAGDIMQLLAELESVAERAGAALVYSHHFSKGNQSMKDAIDRGSGSGVFGRDPDGKLVLTAHEIKDCYTVEFVLRDFAPKQPFVVQFDNGLFHRVEGLRPQDLKKPLGKAKKFTCDMLLEVLGSDKLTAVDWFAQCEQKLEIKRSTFFNRLKELAKSGFLYKDSQDRYSNGKLKRRADSDA